MDAGENDFRVAGGDQPPDLLHRFLRRHGAARAAGVGDDAVGAEGVAAVLDLHEGAAAFGEGGEGEGLCGAALADVGDLGAGGRVGRGGEMLQQVALLLVAENEGNSGDGEEGLRIDLSVTARHHHPAIRIEAPRPADQVARLGVGGGGDGAGVDQDQVGPRFEGDDLVAGPAQAFLQGRRLELVGLAAEGGDGGGGRHSIQPPPRTRSPT